MTLQKKKNLTFRTGIKDGLPIGLGYFSVSFAFGAFAAAKGIPALLALFTSMTNLTSAGQKAGIDVIIASGTVLEILLTQLVINARYFLMSVSLSQKLDDTFTLLPRLICSFAITDEIFAVASGKKEPVNKTYFYGLMLLPYVLWALGTLLGALLGDVLPARLADALGIALYAMFIAIIVPPAMKKLGVAFCIVLAVGLGCLLFYLPVFSVIPESIRYISAALIAATVAALLFPVKEEKGDSDE